MKERLIYLNLVSEESLGVTKKISYQCNAFRKLKFEVINLSRKNYMKFLYKLETKSNGKIKNFFKIISSILLLEKTKNRYFFKKNDILYVRYFGASSILLKYFKNLKKIGVKIILEIPTYPYDNENRENEKESVRDKLDKKYRLELYKYVDKIVTFSDDEEIWRIPCINISNGIDLEKIKLINKIKKDNKVVFTSVSICAFWHGIDRFLYSLLEYKKNNSENNIVFNIVGEGDETSKLKKIVEDNPLLKECVIFYGFKSGKELDEIYNQTDIAVGSLGFFRSGLEKGSTLKVREYIARGLPFILGYDDISLSKNERFYYQLSNDDSLFDLSEIIEWYKNLDMTSQEIRTFAEDNLTWDIQMKKVIENI